MNIQGRLVHVRVLVSLIKEELENRKNSNEPIFYNAKEFHPSKKVFLSLEGWVNKLSTYTSDNKVSGPDEVILSTLLECYVEICDFILNNITTSFYNKEITSLVMSTNSISKRFINEKNNPNWIFHYEYETAKNGQQSLFDDIANIKDNGGGGQFAFELIRKLTSNRARIREVISRVNAEDIFSSVRNDNTNLFNELKSQYNVMMKNFDVSIKSVEELNPKIDSMVSKSLASWSKKNDALTEELSVCVTQAKDRKNEVDDFCTTAMSKVCSILKKAQQQGMAASFQQRHSDLKWPQVIWGIVFVLSLVGLFSLGWYLIEYVFSSNDKSWVEIVSKFSLSLPVIWVTWFAAKQYNHTVQLREDYAYKVAVAMAYHGYKEELDGTNNEMGQKLLENIILHFADNPVRLYKNDSSVSILDSFVKNNNLADLVTAIRGKESK